MSANSKKYVVRAELGTAACNREFPTRKRALGHARHLMKQGLKVEVKKAVQK